MKHLWDPFHLPAEPGLYRLWLDLPHDVPIRVGALGTHHFRAGRYAYTGSARYGIAARVRRHLQAEKPLRWHIDYVIPFATLRGVESFAETGLTECDLNRETLVIPEAQVPVRGFGSSDCRCPAHLVHVPAWAPVPQRVVVPLSTGERATIRLLQPTDAQKLTAYFRSLSARTRSRYGPHRFDEETAAHICATLDPRSMLRVVATVGGGPDERIIAYMLVHRGVRASDGQRYAALGIQLEPDTSGALAPSVADDYQNKGVGSAVMSVLLTMVASVGIRRLVLWDGVIADNHLAQGFYRKWGFQKVGEFETSVLNYDMVMEVPAVPQWRLPPD